MHNAVYFGKEDIVDYLLENGADINVKSDEENTILHLASQAGPSDCWKAFINWN